MKTQDSSVEIHPIGWIRRNYSFDICGQDSTVRLYFYLPVVQAVVAQAAIQMKLQSANIYFQNKRQLMQTRNLVMPAAFLNPSSTSRPPGNGHTRTGCPGLWLRPCPQRHSRSDSTWPWSAWSSWRCQLDADCRGLNKMIFEGPF